MNFQKPHIYRRQIVTTGRYYIGKHKGSNTKYKGSGTDYLIDFKKYVKCGNDLVEEILEYVDDISLLDKREEYWLKKFDVANNPLYYNKTNRSRGWTTVNEQQREKLRQSHLGKKQSLISTIKKREKMTGKPKHTEESKRLIGEKNSHPNPEVSNKLKGRSKTKEHIENIKKSKKNQRNWRPYKVILQYDLKGNFIKEWISLKEIQQSHKGDIRSCCYGKQKTAGGYIWKYKEN